MVGEPGTVGQSLSGLVKVLARGEPPGQRTRAVRVVISVAQFRTPRPTVLDPVGMQMPELVGGRLGAAVYCP